MSLHFLGRAVVMRVGRAVFPLFSWVFGAFLIFAILWGALHWFLSYSEIRVDYFAPSVEQRLNQELTGYEAAVGGLAIGRSDEGYLTLYVDRFVLHSHEGENVFFAPRVKLGFSLDLWSFPFLRLSRFEMIGANLVFYYDHQGRFKVTVRENVPHAASRGARPRPSPVSDTRVETLKKSAVVDSSGEDVTSALGPEGIFFGLLGMPSLDQVSFRDMRMAFVHERFGQRLEVDSGDIVLSMLNDELRVRGQVRWGVGQWRTFMRGSAVIQRKGSGLQLQGRIEEMIPEAGLSLLGSEIADLHLHIPIHSSFEVNFLEDGTLQSMKLAGDLGEGSVHMQGYKGDIVPFKGGVVTMRYDAMARMATVDGSLFHFEGRTLALSGQLVEGDRSVGDSGLWRYAFFLHDIAPGSNGRLPTEVLGEVALIQGGIDFSRNVYSLDHGSFTLGPVDFAFAGDFSWFEDDLRVRLTGQWAPLQVHAFSSVWSPFLPGYAREWLADHITNGTLKDASLNVELHQPSTQKLRFVDLFRSGILEVRFGFEDIVLRDSDGFPLLEGASGQGKLDGARLSLTLDGGYSFPVDGERIFASSGRLEVPDIRFDLPRAEVAFSASGSVSNFLKILDREPFRLFQSRNLDISAVDEGEATVDLRLILPISRAFSFAQADLELSAELEDVSVQKFWGEEKLFGGMFLVNVRDGKGLLAGQGRVAGADVDVEWSFPLRSEGQGEARGPTVTFYLDETVYEVMSGTVSGPIRVDFVPDLTRKEKGARFFFLHADLSKTVMDSPMLGYRKQVGAPARLLAELVSFPNGGYRMTDLEFDASALYVRGRLALNKDGGLESADFSDFRMSQGDDARLKLWPGEGGILNASLGGKRFDMREIMRLFFAKAAVPGEVQAMRPLHLTVWLDEAVGGWGSVLSEMELRAAIHGDGVESLDLTGRFGRSPVSLEMREIPLGQRVFLRSQDAGSVFRFAGLYEYLEGGQTEIIFDVSGERDVLSIGHVKIEDFFVDEKGIANFLPTGRKDKGNRMQFDELSASFKMKSNVISLEESILRGPSIGVIVQGHIDLARDKLDLVGTYIPAYRLNNLLSFLPVIGEALLGGVGGGVLGLTFAVRGSREAPQVVVNPISLITPGILRQFQRFKTLGSGVQELPGDEIGVQKP